MLKRLLLEDFMAHKRTELVFGPGLTVLTGPNNIGKSAVVEALRCVATNPSPKCFIRHGAKFARVEAELEDGARVVWIRKPNTAYYEVYAPGATEPEIYAKFGNKVPDDVQALLKLPLVALDENSDPVDLHLGNQRRPIFLLDQPGSVKAAFFAASTEAAHLLAMQNLLKGKVQAAKREKRDCETRLAGLRQGLDRLATLPVLELGVEDAAALLERIKRLSNLLPRLQERLRGLIELRRKIARLEAGRAALSPLRAPSSLAPLAGLKLWLQNYAQRRAEARRANLRGRELAPLRTPPALFDARSLAVLLRRLAETRRARILWTRKAEACAALTPAERLFPTIDLARSCQRRRELVEALSRERGRAQACAALQAPPSLFPLGRLEALRAGLAAARKALRAAERKGQGLAALSGPPELVDLAPLARLCAGLREAKARRAAADQERAAASQALEALEASIAARLRAIGACPLCGGRLDAGSFLHTGCAHEA